VNPSDERPSDERTTRERAVRSVASRAPTTADDTIVDLQLPEAVRAALKGARAGSPASIQGQEVLHSAPSTAVGGPRFRAPDRSEGHGAESRLIAAIPLTPAQEQQTVAARGPLIPTVAPAAITPQASGPSPLRKADPSRALFRDEALRAYESDLNITSALRTESVGGWAGFALLSIAVGMALAIATLGHVDLTARARGTLQTPEGTALVSAAVEGTLVKLTVEVGQIIAAGDLIAEVDGKAVQAELLRTSRAIEALQARARAEVETVDPLKREALKLLERRAAITRRRVKSQGGDASRLRSRREAYGDLTASGAVSRLEVEQVTDLLAGADRTRLSLLDQLTELESQITATKRQEADRRAALAQELAQAQAQRAAAELIAEQVFVRAPRAGRVESLLVRQGDAVQPGALIAQIVPVEAPRLAVVFVPEHDRAFLEAGRAARIEFDRLPRGEFGTVSATIARVAKEVAPPSEVERHVHEDGKEGAFVRVDLLLSEAALPESLRKHLESGAKLTARVPLRKRRFLSLVFDPVRRWID